MDEKTPTCHPSLSSIACGRQSRFPAARTTTNSCCSGPAADHRHDRMWSQAAGFVKAGERFTGFSGSAHVPFAATRFIFCALRPVRSRRAVAVHALTIPDRGVPLLLTPASLNAGLGVAVHAAGAACVRAAH